MIDIDDPGLSTILVVDHNPAALYVKSWLLSRRGYRVLEAANGTEALTIAKAALPDLTLLDTTLFDISGFDVCHRLKTAPETRFIKVLQTSTARISAPDRVKSLEMGADAYLVEPVEEEELRGVNRDGAGAAETETTGAGQSASYRETVPDRAPAIGGHRSGQLRHVGLGYPKRPTRMVRCA